MTPQCFGSSAIAAGVALWLLLSSAPGQCTADPAPAATASTHPEPKADKATPSDQESPEPFDVNSGIGKKEVKPAEETKEDKPESDKKKDAPEQAPLKIRRESAGLDVIAGPWLELPLSASDSSAGVAMRNAQIHLKFGASERGNVQEFDAARRALDATSLRLTDVNVQRRRQATNTVERLQRETARLRNEALTTFFGRFPLIRAFGLEIEGFEEFQVHSYSMPGNARRRAVLGALTQIGKSASSGPLHVLVLVPGETEHERLSSELAVLVDGESRLAFADVANFMVYAGAIRADVDPMPAWGAPDPAFDSICRELLKQVDPEKEPRSSLLFPVDVV